MRGSAEANPSSSSLTAFKPRQVLLSEQQRRNQAASTPMAKNKPKKEAQIKPEYESILTCSVALWLDNMGFTKVLKRFLSAAQIQDDNWKAKALNLNEIFSKYQGICYSAHEDLKIQKKQEEQVVDITEKPGDANGTTSEEIQSKKKKKKSKGDATANESGRTLDGMAMSEKMHDSYVNGNEDQRHKTSGLSQKDQSAKASKESNGEKIPALAEDRSTKKQKEKKKKKSKLTAQSLDADEKQIDVIPEVTKSKPEGLSSKSSAAELLDGEIAVDGKSKKRSAEAAEDGVNESKKACKKRKRMAHNENENHLGQEVAVEESKSKKSKGLEEGKALPQTALTGANGCAGEQDKYDTFQAGQVDSQKLAAKQTDESTKDATNNNGMDKSSQRKSESRLPKDSADPKKVKAFQRVKVDEVEFVDERLQDNSYWAKNGAETGYGAKAQEVLGQVKGRDFRHEKTKKKRGSYRGGQIDLQSHSIKFNYSDDE